MKKAASTALILALAFALACAFADAEMVVLLNFTDKTVTYDASAVDGLVPLLSSCGAAETGQLRTLEAVIYGSEP